MKNKFVFYLVLASILTCCKDNITPREYPRVKTLEVSNITKTGATFNAEIIYHGNKEITEYGFLWGESTYLTVESSKKKMLTKDITGSRFFAEINTDLEKGKGYFVRAYAKNDKYLVYGNDVSFISLGSK